MSSYNCMPHLDMSALRVWLWEQLEAQSCAFERQEGMVQDGLDEQDFSNQRAQVTPMEVWPQACTNRKAACGSAHPSGDVA